MRKKQWIFLFISILFTFLLSGCLETWVPEIPNTNQTGLMSKSIHGTVSYIETDLIDAGSPYIEIPKLREDQKAIVAISPYETSAEGTIIFPNSFTLTISDVTDFNSTSRDGTFTTQSIKGERKKQENFSDLAEQGKDYFTYAGSGVPMETYFSLQSDIEPLANTYRSFWVRNGHGDDDYTKINATYRNSMYNTSTYLRIYVDDQYWGISDSEIQKIYSTFNEMEFELRDIFGNPRDIGSMGTILLITPLNLGNGSDEYIGYFDERNIYENVTYSNEEDMIYLNAAAFDWGDDDTIFSNVAHEYQHLIFYSQKLDSGRSSQIDDTWFNEGCSVLASTIAGYRNPANDPRIFDDTYGYFKNPNSYSLVDFKETLANYGAAGLFSYYLYSLDEDSYDYHDVIKSVLSSSKELHTAIEQILGKEFSTVFQDWMTANIVDSIGYSPYRQEYQYSDIRLRSVPEFEVLDTYSRFMIKNTGVKYYLFDPETATDHTVHYLIEDYFGDQIPPLNISVIVVDE